jgi:GWxTD domain-containing protein
MKSKSLVGISFLVLALLSSGPARAKDKYKDWEKDIGLIITDSEREEFHKLKKDADKEFFIQLFWAKRDPTPQTEKNEFKEEYYSRLKYVQKSFIFGYNTGTQTDMGKVYLYFGQPLRTFRQGSRVEIWVYPTQPWMNIPKETFSFVFSQVETDYTPNEEAKRKGVAPGREVYGFALDTAQTDSRVMEAFYAYRNQVLRFPHLTELPEYKKAINFSPDSFEGKLIQQVESSGEDVFQIPFEQRILFTKAENLSSYLTLLLKIESQLELPEKLTVFGSLKSEVYSANFRQEITLLAENGHFLAQVGLPVLPGDYELYVGLKTKDEKIYSLKREKLSVPNFWTMDFGISSLIASPEVNARESFREKEFNVFSVGNYSLAPRFSQIYSREQALNVFYYIYNIGVDTDQNCALQIEFEIHYGEQVFKLNPQKIQKKAENGMLLEGTQIPLSALPEPGDYTFVIKITDEIANATASQNLSFTLL